MVDIYVCILYFKYKEEMVYITMHSILICSDMLSDTLDLVCEIVYERIYRICNNAYILRLKIR